MHCRKKKEIQRRERERDIDANRERERKDSERGNEGKIERIREVVRQE